jgi:hypothetical protein
MSARGVKGKKRKRKAKPDNKAQSERFIKAAKELGADESGQAFERAMDSLLQRKTARPPKRGT